MEGNCLFLALPMVQGEGIDNECVYLKSLSSDSPKDVFVNLLKSLNKAFSWTKGELFELFYDRQRFRDLYLKSGLQESTQRPSPLQLLMSLYNLTQIPCHMPIVKVEGVEFDYGIMCFYGNKMQSRGVMIDHQALQNKDHLRIINADGDNVELATIDCNREDIFKWFVHNRFPARRIDSGYAKHSARAKSVAGHIVSACTYCEDEYEEMLKWAVGAIGKSRKYFKDLRKGRLIVFCDENLPNPTFHYYDVDLYDPEENAKMTKDCSRLVLEQIDFIGGIL